MIYNRLRIIFWLQIKHLAFSESPGSVTCKYNLRNGVS